MVSMMTLALMMVDGFEATRSAAKESSSKSVAKESSHKSAAKESSSKSTSNKNIVQVSCGVLDDHSLLLSLLQ